jgi:transketolase
MTAPAERDVRDAFFEALYEIARRDRRVMLLTDDQGAFALTRFRADLEGQYVNAGIAEQNLVAVASGLALAGKRPFLYGITTFVTMRCYEQLKVSVCGMGLPVTIVGSGVGFCYGSDGPTHHPLQDLAIMRALPSLTILSPADAVATAACADIAYGAEGPCYVRLDKGVFPSLYRPGHDFSRGFDVLTPGRDVLLIATGAMVHRALAVAGGLGASGVAAGVLDLHRIKPLAPQALQHVLAGTRRLVTLEEGSVVGGVGSLVAELLADAGRAMPLKRVAAPDRDVDAYGSREWLHARVGLDVPSIVAEVTRWLER